MAALPALTESQGRAIETLMALGPIEVATWLRLHAARIEACEELDAMGLVEMRPGRRAAPPGSGRATEAVEKVHATDRGRRAYHLAVRRGTVSGGLPAAGKRGIPARQRRWKPRA